MEVSTTLIGYPEPEHIYVGKTKIIVFTMFPQVQESTVIDTDDPTRKESCFDQSEPLKYNIEFQGTFLENRMFKESTSFNDTASFAKDVEYQEGKDLCQKFISGWCEDVGIILKD
jgi:hypothetical protein